MRACTRMPSAPSDALSTRNDALRLFYYSAFRLFITTGDLLEGTLDRRQRRPSRRRLSLGKHGTTYLMRQSRMLDCSASNTEMSDSQISRHCLQHLPLQSVLSPSLSKITSSVPSPPLHHASKSRRLWRRNRSHSTSISTKQLVSSRRSGSAYTLSETSIIPNPTFGRLDHSTSSSSMPFSRNHTNRRGVCCRKCSLRDAPRILSPGSFTSCSTWPKSVIRRRTDAYSTAFHGDDWNWGRRRAESHSRSGPSY